ncbi:putative disease resistance protein RGA4 [Malus sylvestris]|uniref:putative disease resistance protein RGA4 n=1 Tax=Malus sylvestris TaxID=3752 RepID=UPI0021ACC482|nr:putative disease resistance protein RGA4 [Malus sylvestris]
MRLEYLPKGTRRSKKLKKIDHRVVSCGGDEVTAALQLGDLELLNFEGDLFIELKGDVEDEREIEKAQLWERKQLNHLRINCEHARYKQTGSTIEILNVLRPHENLESLSIWFHSGNTWPSWLMFLHNLRKLDLYEWSECKYLPPLGKLPCLEELILQGMRKVKKVSGEFLGIDKDETSLTSSSSSFFPKLKKLLIHSMDELEEWEVGPEGWNKEGSEISIMPWLSYLEIRCCGSLKTLSDFLCKTPLQELAIYNCSRLADRCKQGSGEEWPKISHIPSIQVDNF